MKEIVTQVSLQFNLTVLSLSPLFTVNFLILSRTLIEKCRYSLLKAHKMSRYIIRPTCNSAVTEYCDVSSSVAISVAFLSASLLTTEPRALIRFQGVLTSSCTSRCRLSSWNCIVSSRSTLDWGVLNDTRTTSVPSDCKQYIIAPKCNGQIRNRSEQ